MYIFIFKRKFESLVAHSIPNHYQTAAKLYAASIQFDHMDTNATIKITQKTLVVSQISLQRLNTVKMVAFKESLSLYPNEMHVTLNNKTYFIFSKMTGNSGDYFENVQHNTKLTNTLLWVG